MIDTFTREQFEQALPKVDGHAVCSLGVMQNEYAYVLPVTDVLGIHIRSSVGSAGISASTGEDSIRCWIVRLDTGEAWGNKVAKYVTRVPGWQERLLRTLRKLWKMARAVHACPRCDQLMHVFICKQGANKGRVFLKCVNDRCPRKTFEWVEGL